VTAAGILLYGPPASGKDTVTAALQRRLGGRVVHYAKLKVGAGRTAGYRFATPAELDQLRRSGDVLYENERYGNVYAVDRPGLLDIVRRSALPVLHMGQLAGVRAVREATALPWLSVLVWCDRETAAQRLRQRGSGDLDARLRAWDETAGDLTGQRPGDFDLVVDTAELDPEAAAAVIAGQLAQAKTA
jgi:guanylate kinase